MVGASVNRLVVLVAVAMLVMMVMLCYGYFLSYPHIFSPVSQPVSN